MCWPDRHALGILTQIRDQFETKVLIETGSAEGNWIIMYSKIFLGTYGCEIDKEFHKICRRRISRLKISPETSHLHSFDCLEMTSPHFIDFMEKRRWTHDVFMLDAHTPGSWPILEELKALRGSISCLIVIHDFKVEGEELGYICYDGQALNLPLVEKDLFAVNPDFCLYTNTRETCDIWPREELRVFLGKQYDEYFDKAMDYVWSKPEKTYRGILYATPEPLCNSMGLRRIC